MKPYEPARYKATAFNCPHCEAFAHQVWFKTSRFAATPALGATVVSGLELSQCTHCGKFAIWLVERMIYPVATTAPLPNPDLPVDVKEDYAEASAIVGRSPRGAAALLRLSIQKLCVHLGEPGKDLNSDIANLVRQGLDPKIQKALDVVRVVGNNAVHPGELDIKDDAATALKLFDLVNMVADSLITRPREIDKLFTALPAGAKKAIEKRDKQ